MDQFEFGESAGRERSRERIREGGFTLIEVLVATVVLIIVLVSVAQMVPIAMNLNARNRADSTALVMVQRELNQMTGQPLSAVSFIDAQGNTCNLGNPASPNTLVGSSVGMVSNQPKINFAAAKVTGYNFTYRDPNDPSQTSYDLRWAVITVASGGNAYAKRFIVGARRLNGNGPLLPVNIDTLVEK